MSGWASGWVRGRDLAIDLGTANTVIYERGRGVVLDEPSVVAIRTGSSQLVAAGHRAKEMLGRTPESVTAVRPLRDGVISDADVTERMIRWFVEQVSPSRLIRPRVVVCVPSDITSVERRALEDATLRSGARRVYVIEETMAAAIGAGLPVEDTRASMVVDVGGGTTDVAIISLGGVVTSRTVRIGGDEIDDALVAHVKSEYSLLLGERSAEDLKIGAGSAFPLREELTERVRGRDLVTGLPKTVSIGSAEVRRAIEKAADWAVGCRNADGGFGHFPGRHSDMDAVYFQLGTLIQAGRVRNIDETLGDADRRALGWGHAMRPERKP